ncbi:MAG: FadR/GntR family transcriptional regulator [Desulfopila sp.]
MDVQNHFKPIEVQDPAEMIVQQIRDLISSGVLKPGQRLPSEVKMEKSFKVPRSVVRRALKRLSTFGVVNIVAHSGTYVAGLGIEALAGVFSNILELEKKDYQALAEVRLLLERHAVRAAATSLTAAQLAELEGIQQEYAAQVKRGIVSLNEDLVFHVRLAEFTENPVLKTLVSLLTSEALHHLGRFTAVVGEETMLARTRRGVEEHRAILAGIRGNDPEQAVRALEEHYRQALRFADGCRQTERTTPDVPN